MPLALGGFPLGGTQGGGRRGASVKTLKRMLKKAGLKTSGRKAALTRRAKKAHLKMGGDKVEVMGGRRRRHRGGDDEVPKDCKLNDSDQEMTGYKNTVGRCVATREEADKMLETGESGGRRRRGSRRH